MVVFSPLLGNNPPLQGIKKPWTWGVVTYEPYSQKTQGFGQQESGCVIEPTNREMHHAQASWWLGCASQFSTPRNHGSNPATTVECLHVDRWYSHLYCFHHKIPNACPHCHLTIFNILFFAGFNIIKPPFDGQSTICRIISLGHRRDDARRNSSGLRLKNVFVSSTWTELSHRGESVGLL